MFSGWLYRRFLGRSEAMDYAKIGDEQPAISASRDEAGTLWAIVAVIGPTRTLPATHLDRCS